MKNEFDINAIAIDDIVVDSNQNFLIVDDEGLILEYLEELLQLLSFNGKILKAGTIQEAKKHLKYEKINYIISDRELPDGNGIAFLKAIRKSKRFHNIPFLMITGDSSVSTMLLSQKYGHSDYLVKPFTFEDFKLKLIEGWKNHILPKQDEIHALKQKIIDLEEQNEKLKAALNAMINKD